MSDSKFQPGDFVRHDQLGIGRIEAVDGNPAVVFWANRETGKSERIPPVFLKSVPNGAPEALLWGSPDKLKKWVESAPLKLVAAALSISGGSGKMADIRERLDGRIPGLEWEGWWKKTQPKIRKQPEHFEIAKPGKDTEYGLRTSVHAIPDVDASKPGKRTTDKKPANKTVWAKWFVSGTDEPPPGATGYPTKAASDALSDLQDEDIRRTLTKLLHWTGEFLSKGEREKTDKRAALAWRDMLATATVRWRNHAEKQGLKDDLSAQASVLLGQMAHAAGYDKATLDLIHLVNDLVLDVIGTSQINDTHQDNLTLLDYLSPGEKNQLVTVMAQRAADNCRIHDEEMVALRKAHEEKLAHLVNSHNSALRESQKKHDAQLTQKNAEMDQVNRKNESLVQHLRERNTELQANRQKSRLEIQWDILVAIGAVLQSVLRSAGDDKLKGDVEAGLNLALYAGGAEPLEAVGAIVEYKPRWHEALDVVPESSRVRVVAPGVTVRGGIHGDSVVIRAKVEVV